MVQPEGKQKKSIAAHRVVRPTHKNGKHGRGSVDKRLVKGFELLLDYMGRDNDLTKGEKRNFADTAVRAAKAFRDLTATKTEILKGVKEILQTGFPLDKAEDYKPGVICQGPIKVFSICPHHLLGVEYDCYIAYVPKHDGVVLGISKLSRIAELVGRRPVLQEQLAADIADVFCINEAQSPWIYGIETLGSAVMLIGRHSCMTCRGVKSGSLTSMNEVRGVFWDRDMEMRFLSSARELRESSLRT